MNNIKEKYINISLVNDLTEGDLVLTNHLLSVFKNQVLIIIENLLKSLQDKDYEQIRFYAHKAKNDLQQIGINNLAEKMRKLEDLSKSKSDFYEITKLISCYIEETQSIMLEVETYLN